MARILLVEGDADVRPLMEHILLDNGYDVAATETVATATDLLGALPFDLLICDVNLPDGSRLAVTGAAKAAGIRALVVTGRRLNLKPGSLARYDYLLKPRRGAELLREVAQPLTEREDRADLIKFPKAILNQALTMPRDPGHSPSPCRTGKAPGTPGPLVDSAAPACDVGRLPTGDE